MTFTRSRRRTCVQPAASSRSRTRTSSARTGENHSPQRDFGTGVKSRTRERRGSRSAWVHRPIGQIVIDPAIRWVYVAEQGPLSGGGESGLYRITYGGATWSRRYISENTVDTASCSTHESDIIYVARTRRRTSASRSGGRRPGSSSHEGGRAGAVTNGLAGDIGRIALAIDGRKTPTEGTARRGVEGNAGFLRSTDVARRGRGSHDVPGQGGRGAGLARGRWESAGHRRWSPRRTVQHLPGQTTRSFSRSHRRGTSIRSPHLARRPRWGTGRKQWESRAQFTSTITRECDRRQNHFLIGRRRAVRDLRRVGTWRSSQPAVRSIPRTESITEAFYSCVADPGNVSKCGPARTTNSWGIGERRVKIVAAMASTHVDRETITFYGDRKTVVFLASNAHGTGSGAGPKCGAAAEEGGDSGKPAALPPRKTRLR